MSLRTALQQAVISGLKSNVSGTICKSKNIKAATSIDQSTPVILVTVNERRCQEAVLDELRLMLVEVRVMTLKEEDDAKASLISVVDSVDSYMRTAHDYGSLDGYTQCRESQMIWQGMTDEDNDPDWHQSAGLLLVPFAKANVETSTI